MPVQDYKKKRGGKKLTKKQREERKERRQRKRDLNVRRHYGKLQPTRFLQQPRYRVLLVRTDRKRRKNRYADITGAVDSLTWQEEDSTTTGSLSLVRPKPLAQEDKRFDVRDGNLIKLQMKYGGKWRVVFVLRVQNVQMDVGAGTASYELADDSVIFKRSEGDFKFVKDDENRPKGWKAHQIARKVCQEWRIPVGRLAKGTEYLDNIKKDGVSPLEIITEAYKEERDATGQQYIMSWRRGKLEIVRLRRSKILWSLKEQILSAAVERNSEDKIFTVVHLTGNYYDKEKTKKKLDIKVENKRAVRRYGRIVKQIKLEETAQSKERARIKAKRRLARALLKNTQPTISVTHVGIPWLKRGDAVEIRLPNYGFKGKPRPVKPFGGGHYNILFVTSISHQLGPDGLVSSIEFNMTDPVAEMKKDIRDKRDKDKRDKKREERDGNN